MQDVLRFHLPPGVDEKTPCFRCLFHGSEAGISVSSARTADFRARGGAERSPTRVRLTLGRRRSTVRLGLASARFHPSPWRQNKARPPFRVTALCWLRIVEDIRTAVSLNEGSVTVPTLTVSDLVYW